MADNMGQGKIPCYSHRLMHRKRVTCELHDSYFPWMTIKHAIPEIVSGRLNYYITRCGQEVSELEIRCGRESHYPAEGAFWTLDWVWRPVGEKMLGWEHVPERLGPQTPGWAVQENENDTRLCPEGLGRSICCSSVRSPTPSHTQSFQIKWEVYFSKNCVARLYNCVNMYSTCICKWICIWLYNSLNSEFTFS